MAKTKKRKAGGKRPAKRAAPARRKAGRKAKPQTVFESFLSIFKS